jgi:hypothetical protein
MSTQYVRLRSSDAIVVPPRARSANPPMSATAAMT